jgi:hypothetical protein
MKLFKVFSGRGSDSTATRAGSNGSDARRGAPSDWRAVSIKCAGEACDAARDCGATRWLSAEAPRLPLPSCRAGHCECVYRHHADRRTGPRRRFDLEFFARPFIGDDRRREAGRRQSDR